MQDISCYDIKIDDEMNYSSGHKNQRFRREEAIEFISSLANVIEHFAYQFQLLTDTFSLPEK